MPETRFYEDVQIGDEIQGPVKRPTTRQLVMWAGASDDYAEPHYDQAVARARGLPGVLVHGRLKAAFLGQMLTDWMGVDGTLRQFSCRFRGADFPGGTLACKGQVSQKYVAPGGDHCVECQVWVENEQGVKTVDGKALVVLPSRR